MKSKMSLVSVIGLIIWEGIGIVDLVVSLHTGKMTYMELFTLIAISVLLVLALHYYFAGKRRKDRE